MTASASVGSDFDKLLREFDGCLAEVLGVAKAAATTMAAPWRAIVEAMTGQPPSGTLPAAGQGANPSEVRTVLLSIQALYSRRLQVVERAAKQCEPPAEVEDAIWTFRHRRLDSFVEDELTTYIKSVNPRPTVGGVFAKAAGLARPPMALTALPGGGVELHRCKTCAAPRLGDGLYGNCLYCGHPLFTGRDLEVD